MLRAAKNGKLRILIPMITTLDEINKAKELIDEAKAELIKEKYIKIKNNKILRRTIIDI